jgi:hypothetical protein
MAELSLCFDAPVAIAPGKESPIPIGYETGWPQSRSGRYGAENIMSPTGNQTPSVQPVAHRYTY